MTDHTIRVALVDDHKAFVQGLALLLGTHERLSVVGLAHNGRDAMTLCQGPPRPHVVLLDIDLPLGNGMQLGPRIMALEPPPRVIYFSMFANPEFVLRAIAMGAAGYLLKSLSADELVAAVRQAHHGKPCYCAAVRRIAAAMGCRGVKPRRSDPVLPERQQQVLKLLSRGLSRKETAQKLGLAVGTVRTLKLRAQQTLGLRTLPLGQDLVIKQE